MTTTRHFQVNRLEAAYQIALETGNTRLAKTLKPMLDKERVRSVKSTSRTNVGERIISTSRKAPRPVYNPKRAAIKLKNELYDTRIELDSPEVIEERRQRFHQRRLVLKRGHKNV